jgi:hypothetical protein
MKADFTGTFTITFGQKDGFEFDHDEFIDLKKLISDAKNALFVENTNNELIKKYEGLDYIAQFSRIKIVKLIEYRETCLNNDIPVETTIEPENNEFGNIMVKRSHGSFVRVDDTGRLEYRYNPDDEKPVSITLVLELGIDRL